MTTPLRRLLLAAPLALLATGALPADSKGPAKTTLRRAARRVRRADAAGPMYGRREEVMALADEIAARRNLDAAWVRAVLAGARRVPAVERLVMPPAAGTAKNWAAYRARFVEPVRLRAGLAFWNAQAAWLQQAEERFGVPPDIVVGILGVETLYGRHMGDFRTLDALATLSFDFPTGRKDRSPFFRAQLESLVAWCSAEGRDPLAVRGSYAGAIGMPQFMPESIEKCAIDFDGDGHIDLHDSAADAIGSVARFLLEHGWTRGMPTHFGVAAPVDTAERALLLGPDILPSFTPAQFAQHGAVLQDEGAAFDGLLALVELQNGDAAPSYVAGTPNFYALTRYNWSSYYAMAVMALGDAVREKRQASA